MRFYLFILFLAGVLDLLGASQALDMPKGWASGGPLSVQYKSVSLPLAGSVVNEPVYALPQLPDPRVTSFEDFFTKEGRDWLMTCWDNSLPYRDFIQFQLKDYGVPEEIFWLAAVESGFSTTAVSRAGAVGMWQFMRNSISGYDMHITPYIDERKDFWKSTIGAIRKLKDNYNYYGDWYLALAAYNAGSPRIDRAIRKSGGIRDYWTLVDQGYLPRETSAYVPQILAMSKILSQKTKYGFPLDWDESVDWDRVDIEKPVDLRLLAQAAGVPYEELYKANRELRYPITPETTYKLKVPTAWKDSIQKALNDPEMKLIRFYFYTIQRGDTLSELSQWYDVNMSVIQKYNPGVNPDSLRINQTLIIPALKDIGPFQKKHRVKTTVAYTEKNKASSSDVRAGGSYKVKKGDTLYSIAKHSGTTISALAWLNHIAEEASLDIGQVLVLPEGSVREP